MCMILFSHIILLNLSIIFMKIYYVMFYLIILIVLINYYFEDDFIYLIMDE